jgi:hypothetical protein
MTFDREERKLTGSPK